MELASETYFLTQQERDDLEREMNNPFSLVGALSYDYDESFMFRQLKQAFQRYPVQWANSKDLLYAEPYDSEDLLSKLAKDEHERIENEGIDPNEARKKFSLPWTYQDGAVFQAYLVRESPRAFLLRFKFGTSWVPKSQVDFEPNEVWLPDWLIKDKLLDKKDALYQIPFEWEPALIEGGKVIVPQKTKMKKIKVKS